MKTYELIGTTLDWAVAKAEEAAGSITFDPDVANMPNEKGAPPYCTIVGKQTYLWGAGTTQPGTFNEKTGKPWVFHGNGGMYSPSTNWSQGGPIIEREKIATEPLKEGDGWCACLGCTPHDFLMWDQQYNSGASYGEGPTPLIAAMRCYVASKLGDEVEIPEELK